MKSQSSKSKCQMTHNGHGHETRKVSEGEFGQHLVEPRRATFSGSSFRLLDNPPHFALVSIEYFGETRFL